METEMRIIFLDVDGVLNNQASLMQNIHVMPEKVILLNQLVERTGAVIVLSSTWRRNHTALEMQKILQSVGGYLCKVIDMTTTKLRGENGRSVDRGAEIQEWLDRHADEVTGYVIIDDDSDMLPKQMDNFVQTDLHTGLTQSAVGRAAFYIDRNQAAGLVATPV